MVLLGIVILIMAATSFASDCGDVNNDGTVDVLDIVYLINYKYKSGPAPEQLLSADVNGDGNINILDIVYLINYKYKGGLEPNCGPETGTMIDIDGNIYQTVKIGEQWWMMENLKVIHYRNGDAIPNVTDETVWAGLITGAYCNYNNDVNNVATYGRLYNWYSAADSRNIAPDGWHVPSDAEWQTLVDYLGGGSVAGGKMKEAGTTHWQSPNTGATNASGFSGLPGSFRGYDGNYYNIGYVAGFWSSSDIDNINAWYVYLNYDNSEIYSGNYYKRRGFSVRCVKD